MKSYYRITEDELLAEEHFPVKAIFNMVKDDRFRDIVKGISNNSGFGENYGACVFWNDLDDFDKQNTPFYEGAEFGLHSGEEIIIDSKELLYYLNLVCNKYCKDHLDDKKIIWEYVNKYKQNNKLS